MVITVLNLRDITHVLNMEGY